MRLHAATSQLLLVDYQARLMPAIHGAEALLANARRLATLAPLLGVPVWGTEQVPDKLGPNVAELRAACTTTLAKQAFGACDDGLLDLLAAGLAADRTQLVVAGCEAHVCLLQTALGLREAGHDVWVVEDACGSRTEANHEAAMSRLVASGITLVTTEMVGFEWLARADHPAFRAWQALIR